MTENNFWHSSWFHLKSWDESSQKSMHKNVGVSLAPYMEVLKQEEEIRLHLYI